MIEFLGVLVAAGLLGLGWLGWRALRALGTLLRRIVPRRVPLRAAPLRLARLRLRRADARAASQAEEIRRLRVALRQAQQERDALRIATAATGRDRFQEAKRAFALRFHPDRIGAQATERAIRTALFREYWAELRRIERG